MALEPRSNDLSRYLLLTVLALLLAAAVLLWRAGQLGQLVATEPRILYLAWDELERVQLYVTSTDGRAPRPLTAVERRVVDYAPAPDGALVVFSSERGEGQQSAGSNLWLAPVDGDGEPTLLLDCGGDYCSGPVWAPDGERLLYERRSANEAGEEPSPPRLWWLAPDSGRSAPLFSDEQLYGHSARFSGDGSWLALVVPLVQALQFYHFETGDLIEMSNEIGEPVAWHPGQSTLVTSNIDFVGETAVAHLFRVDMPEAQATDLTGEALTNDAAPAWSPDGQWIVFGRRVPGTPTGRQLWLMRPDGSQSSALTNDPESNFGMPSWSPDREQILVQRFIINQPNAEPGIWLVDVDDGQLHEVVEVGFQPSWLP